MDSNHRYRKISHRFETDFCRLHDGSRSRKGFTSFATGDRQFEFTSLQRRVSCEPDFLGSDFRKGQVARPFLICIPRVDWSLVSTSFKLRTP